MSANQALYGLGGEDQAGQTDAAPAAVPVAVATPTGSSIDIDVAASAYDPDGPGQPEVVGTGTPASGVVTVVNGKIRYTPFAGYVGLDRFTYTLDNAGKRSSSLVQVTVTAASELPPVLRTIMVANSTQLTAALAGNFSGLATVPAGTTGPLRPGDHIACAPGTYAGTFTMSVSGTQTNPIFIKRASDTGTVTFSGRINLRGAWCGLHRLRFTGDALKVDISGRGGRVTRCLFDTIGYDGIVYLTGSSHPDIRIDHNEFRDIVGSAVRSEIDSSLDHQNMRIDHNYFNGHTVTSSNESVLLVLTDAFRDAFLVYEGNLFVGCLKDPSNLIDEKEMISVKTGSARVRNNTVLDCDAGFISLRETNRSIVEGNWLENGSFIKMHGDDHTIRNNRSTGKLCEVRSGDEDMDAPIPPQCTDFGKAGRTPIIYTDRCKTAHACARNALLEHNIGSIIVGTAGEPFKAQNTTLRNNDRAATRMANSWTGITETGIGGHSNTAVKLTPADVGPDAV